MEYRYAAKSNRLSRAKDIRFRPWQALSILMALLALFMISGVSAPALLAMSAAPAPESWTRIPPSASQTALSLPSAVSNLHSESLSKGDPDSDDCHPAGFRSGSATILTCHHDTARLNFSQSHWPAPSAVSVTFGRDGRYRIPEIGTFATSVSPPVPVPPPL